MDLILINKTSFNFSFHLAPLHQLIEVKTRFTVLPHVFLLRNSRVCSVVGSSIKQKPVLLDFGVLELFGYEGSNVIIKQLVNIDTVHFPSPADYSFWSSK